MALINCPECEHQISDKAKSCPQCGVPVIIKEVFKCLECDSEISEKALSCPTCGAPNEKANRDKTNTPPPKKEATKPDQPIDNKKSSTWKIITPLIILTLIGFIFIVVENNPNIIPGVKIDVNTPKPIVVTSRADGSKSGLLKARTTVFATVQNQGGGGNVLVTFHVYQNGNDYDRSKSIYLGANQSKDLEMTFDEVKMLGGEIRFHVDVRAE